MENDSFLSFSNSEQLYRAPVVDFFSFFFSTVRALMGGLVYPRGMWSWQTLLWSVGTGRGDVGGGS